MGRSCLCLIMVFKRSLSRIINLDVGSRLWGESIGRREGRGWPGLEQNGLVSIILSKMRIWKGKKGEKEDKRGLSMSTVER